MVERVDVAQGRQEENRRLGSARKRSEALAHGEAVEPGHPDVEQDAIGRLLGEQRQRLLAAGCHDDAVSLVLECALRQDAIRLIVVDDENRLRGNARGRHVQFLRFPADFARAVLVQQPSRCTLELRRRH